MNQKDCNNSKYIYIMFIVYVGFFIYAVFLQYNKKNITYENVNKHSNLIPIKNTLQDISILWNNGFRKNMNLFANIIGNILLFMPLPFFLIEIFNFKKNIYILLFAILISGWVEAMQYVFLLGVTDIDDVMLNITGCYLGIFFARCTA